MIPESDWVYDLETYPNIFTAAFLHSHSGNRRLFEVSNRKNDLDPLMIFLKWLAVNNQRLVGFNNLAFDYPVLHNLIDTYLLTPKASTIYKKAQQLKNPKPQTTRNKDDAQRKSKEHSPNSTTNNSPVPG